MREKYLIKPDEEKNKVVFGMMYNNTKSEIVIGCPIQYQSELIYLLEQMTLRAIDKVEVKITKKKIVKYFFQNVDRKVYKLWHNRLRKLDYIINPVSSIGKVFGNTPIKCVDW